MRSNPSKLENWIKKNVRLPFDKTIAITGATSGIGRSFVRWLSKTDNHLIAIARSEERLSSLISSLNGPAKITPLKADLQKKEDVLDLLSFVRANHIDFFINNAGLYHRPIKMNEMGLDETYWLDYLLPIILTKEVTSLYPDARVINVSSIAHRRGRYDPSDPMGLSIKGKTSRYASYKRMLTLESVYLRNQGKNVFLVHPGVSNTGLFERRNGSYGRFFYAAITPLIHLFFMDPDKASLSLLKSLEEGIDPPILSYIGPKAFFGMIGYPKETSLRLPEKEEEHQFLDEYTDSMIEEILG